MNDIIGRNTEDKDPYCLCFEIVEEWDKHINYERYQREQAERYKKEYNYAHRNEIDLYHQDNNVFRYYVSGMNRGSGNGTAVLSKGRS